MKKKSIHYKHYELRHLGIIDDWELIDKKTGMIYGYPKLVSSGTDPKEVLKDFLVIYKLA